MGSALSHFEPIGRKVRSLTSENVETGTLAESQVLLSGILANPVLSESIVSPVLFLAIGILAALLVKMSLSLRAERKRIGHEIFEEDWIDGAEKNGVLLSPA